MHPYPMVFLAPFIASPCFILACVASVSVYFRSKKKQGTGFSVLTAREMKREPFFAPSLTLVPRSLLLNRTETIATQASFILA